MSSLTWEKILEIQERARWSAQTTTTQDTTTVTTPTTTNRVRDKKVNIPTVNKLKDTYIDRSRIVLNKSGSGSINELIIKSTSDFSVEVEVDGITLYHDSVSSLNEFSSDISGLTATIHNSYYIFGLNETDYYNSLLIRIYVPSKQKFDLIYYSVI